MLKFDKLFAGLILLAMAAFWVVISPASLTSRSAEAKPTLITPQADPAAKRKKKATPPAEVETTRRPPSLLNMNSTEYRRNLERRSDEPLVLPPLN